MTLIVVDLFAGIGGLSFGFEQKGCKVYSYEMDSHCVQILSKRHVTKHVKLNVESFDKQCNLDFCHVLVGGPPCQSFSKAGAQKGKEDERNQIPTFLAAIKKLTPKVFLMENVENLHLKHSEYFDQVISEMKSLGYRVRYKVLDCSYYQVPQKRKRLFVVGFKSKSKLEKFQWPEPSSKQMLVNQVLVSKDCYSQEQGFIEIDKDWQERITKYENRSKTRPRDLYFDEPSRTLTCKNLCAKTNDVIRILNPSGKRRTLTVAEACKIQTIPESWLKDLPYNIAMKCIGNSVPTAISLLLASQILKCLQ
jgi:DNA-cytosine methyltransferase